MGYEKLKDVLAGIDDYDFEESSCKMGLNYQNLEDKDERCEKFQNEILSNPNVLLKPYGKETLKYLVKICMNDNVEFDMDYNTLVCDGVCYLEKVDGKEYIKVTNDFKEAFLSMMKNEDAIEKIEMYDTVERLINGIIKTYAALKSEDIFETFIDVKASSEDEFEDEDEFDHFLYHRDGIINTFVPYDYDGEEYIIVEDLIDPDEVIEDLQEQDKSRKILSRDEYLTFANGGNYVTDEKALDEFKKLITNLTKNDDATNDIVNTVMYDIKMGNLDDLMLDIMTYVELNSEDEHEQIKTCLSNLYEKTPTWFGEYLK